MSWLADDYAGLEQFAVDAAAGNRPKPRKVVAKGDASPVDVLRSVLSAHFLRVIDLFREWDDDGNNMVSSKEFRQALPMLGLEVNRADAEALFAEFDTDSSGEIDLAELKKMLRPTAEPDATPGPEIETFSTLRAKASANHHGLKEGVSTVLGQVLDSSGDVVEQLQRALSAQLQQCIALFRSWDEDSSGEVSKKEFRRALPALGLLVSHEEADALFDSLDSDHSGSIEYGELQRKLREKRVRVKGRAAKKAESGGAPTESILQARAAARNAAMAEELAARQSLTKLKRQLRRAQQLQARAQEKQAKMTAVAEMRKEHERLVGRDMNAIIAAIPKATPEEQKELSEQLNEQLAIGHREARTTPNPDREWYTLFKSIDTDGSGRISFKEFRDAVRHRLRLSKAQLPDEKIFGLWRALDEDMSGFIDAGEFGRFLKLGAPVLVRARDILHAERHADKREMDAELDKLVGRDVNARFAEAGVSAASEEEVTNLANVFNVALSRLSPEYRHWSAFFRIVDEDGSGRISFEELEKYVRGNPHMVTGAMGMSRTRLPDARLFALWLALDVDGSGFIDAGEFGRFMRKAASGSGNSSARGGGASLSAVWRPIAALSSRSRVSPEDILSQEVLAQELSAQRSLDNRQQLLEETRRLEEALAKLQPEYIAEAQMVAPESPKLPSLKSPGSVRSGRSSGKSFPTRGKSSGPAKSARLPAQTMRLYGLAGPSESQSARGPRIPPMRHANV